MCAEAYLARKAEEEASSLEGRLMATQENVDLIKERGGGGGGGGGGAAAVQTAKLMEMPKAQAEASKHRAPGCTRDLHASPWP